MHSNKRNWIRIVSMIGCFSLIIFLIPIFALPVMSTDSSRIMGLWWWGPQDGRDASERSKYLDFFEQAGITEIYYYGFDDLRTNRPALHTFVSAANAKGMTVAILYDDKNICEAQYAESLIDSLKTNYLAYIQQYPDDQMIGYHFDIEKFSSAQNYCTNFIGGLSTLRDAGILCSVDVNPTHWTSSVSLNGVSGMYNIIAANVDVMTLMSYRQNADKVVSCGETCLAACKTYGTAIRYGLETGDSGEEGVDFYGKTKYQLYTVINGVFERLKNKNLDIEYGMAIHHNRAFYAMEGELPDIHATTAPKPTVIGGGIVGRVLYQDLNLSIQQSMQGDTSYIITNEELASALDTDFAENGLINPDLGEYYKITVNIRANGNAYCYPCLWDAEDGWDFWAASASEDYPNGLVVRSTPMELISIIHSLHNTRENKDGKFVNANDGVLLYLEEYSRTLYITGLTVEVFRLEGATVITAPTQTTTTTNTTTTTTSVNSSVISDVSGQDIIKGDANNDTIVDMKDVLLVRKAIANHSLDGIVFIETAADYNGDKVIDMKDILAIRKAIANVPV